MRKLALTLAIIIPQLACASDNASDDYVKSKQAHAEILKEKADDRVADLRSNIGSDKPNLLSTSAGLGQLEPSSGPSNVTVIAPPASTKPVTNNDNSNLIKKPQN